MINSTKPSWQSNTNDEPQWHTLGAVPFNIFINDKDDGTECAFGGCVGDTKLGRVADMPKGCGAIQTDFTWPMNLVKFKYWVLALGRINPTHQYMLVADFLESKWEEKDQVGPSGHIEHDINVPCGKGGQQALGLH